VHGAPLIATRVVCTKVLAGPATLVIGTLQVALV